MNSPVTVDFSYTRLRECFNTSARPHHDGFAGANPPILGPRQDRGILLARKWLQGIAPSNMSAAPEALYILCLLLSQQAWETIDLPVLNTCRSALNFVCIAVAMTNIDQDSVMVDRFTHGERTALQERRTLPLNLHPEQLRKTAGGEADQEASKRD